MRAIAISATAVALLVAACSSPASAPSTVPSPTADVSPTPYVKAPPSAEVITLQPYATPTAPFDTWQLQGGPSGITVVGSESPDQGSGASLLLSSAADAASWAAYRNDPGGGLSFVTLGDGPAGLLATVRQSEGVALPIYASSDRGVTWTRTASLEDAGISAIIGGPSGYLLLGDQTNPGLPEATTAWLTADGSDPGDPIDLPSLAAPAAIALPQGFLVFDSGMAGVAPWLGVVTAAGATPVPVAAIGFTDGTFLPAAVLVGDRLVVVRQDEAGATAWTSDVGTLGPMATFRRVESLDGPLLGASVVAGAASPAGAVLLAFDRATLERVALTSADGLAWTRHVLPADALGGALTRELVATDAGFVAVGRAVTLAGGADTLWRSRDGSDWELAPAPFGPPSEVPVGACPVPPRTLEELATLGEAKAASCFSRKDLRISAFIGSCGGCGGTTLYTWTPGWLGGMFAPLYLATAVAGAATGGGGFAAWPDPSHDIAIPAEGTPVRVTGHFEDPVAGSCRVVPTGAMVAALPPLDEAIASCRRSFVVTKLEVAR